MALPEQRLRTMHLFAGAGGGILADCLLGHLPVCAVEIDAYARSVLLARQRDGILPRFPIWDDVCTFDGKPWRGKVEIVAGGFPCQDISAAGKGAGIEGHKSGLWKQMGRIIREVEPEWVLVENSPLLTLRGLDAVLWDLDEMGYDAEWGVLGADSVGGCHSRKRIWIYASHHRIQRVQRSGAGSFPWKSPFSWCKDVRGIEDLRSRPDLYPSGLCRNYHGIPDGMERIKRIGNSQVPIVAASAFQLLSV